VVTARSHDRNLRLKIDYVSLTKCDKNAGEEEIKTGPRFRKGEDLPSTGQTPAGPLFSFLFLINNILQIRRGI
jgi:hypothetical protein